MGLFGGSSQSTSSSSNILDFNPVFNIGDGNTSKQDKELSATQSTSPELDDSFGLSASVGVGVGGTGSGGTAQLSRSQEEDNQPLTTKTATTTSAQDNTMFLYGAIALGGFGLFYLMSKKKRAK